MRRKLSSCVNVSPTLTELQVGNVGLGDSIFQSDDALDPRVGNDLSYLLLSKRSAGIPLPTRPTRFIPHVLLILGTRPEKEVIRIEAASVIAPVANRQIRVNVSVHHLVRQAVNLLRDSSRPRVAVAPLSHVSRPIPTSGLRIDLLKRLHVLMYGRPLRTTPEHIRRAPFLPSRIVLATVVLAVVFFGTNGACTHASTIALWTI